MTLVTRKTEKKSNNFNMIETFTEILKESSNKKLFEDFRDKYNAWCRKFSEEWNAYETSKSNGFEALKPTRFIRTAVTTIFFFCYLEYFRTTNILFLKLAFGTITVFLSICVISLIIVSFFSAPSFYLNQVLEYLKSVNAMAALFSTRLNLIKRILHLNFYSHDLYIYNENENKNSFWNLLLSALFVFNIYGAMLAAAASAVCYNAQYDSSLLLESLIVYFLIIVSLKNDMKIFTSLGIIKRIQKQIVITTEDFKFWFQNDCELKCILKELNIKDDKLLLFPSKNFIKEEYFLNFAIFLVMFENAVRRYLNTNRASELLLYLISGNKGKLGKIVMKNGVNVSTNQNLIMSSYNHDEKDREEIKNSQYVNELACNTVKGNNTNKPKIKADILSPDHYSCMSPTGAKDDVHDNKAICKDSSYKKANESRIPRLTSKTKNSNIAKSEASPTSTDSKLQEALKFDENLQFRRELTPNSLKQDFGKDFAIVSFENISEPSSLTSSDEESQNCNNGKSSGDHTPQDFNDSNVRATGGNQNESTVAANEIAKCSCDEDDLDVKNKSETGSQSEGKSHIDVNNIGEHNAGDNEILKNLERMMSKVIHTNSSDSPESAHCESCSNGLEFYDEKTVKSENLSDVIHQKKNVVEEEGSSNLINKTDKPDFSSSNSTSDAIDGNQNDGIVCTSESSGNISGNCQERLKVTSASGPVCMSPKNKEIPSFSQNNFMQNSAGEPSYEIISGQMEQSDVVTYVQKMSSIPTTDEGILNSVSGKSGKNEHDDTDENNSANSVEMGESKDVAIGSSGESYVPSDDSNPYKNDSIDRNVICNGRTKNIVFNSKNKTGKTDISYSKENENITINRCSHNNSESVIAVNIRNEEAQIKTNKSALSDPEEYVVPNFNSDSVPDTHNQSYQMQHSSCMFAYPSHNIAQNNSCNSFLPFQTSLYHVEGNISFNDRSMTGSFPESENQTLVKQFEKQNSIRGISPITDDEADYLQESEKFSLPGAPNIFEFGKTNEYANTDLKEDGGFDYASSILPSQYHWLFSNSNPVNQWPVPINTYGEHFANQDTSERQNSDQGNHTSAGREMEYNQGNEVSTDVRTSNVFKFAGMNESMNPEFKSSFEVNGKYNFMDQAQMSYLDAEYVSRTEDVSQLGITKQSLESESKMNLEDNEHRISGLNGKTSSHTPVLENTEFKGDKGKEKSQEKLEGNPKPPPRRKTLKGKRTNPALGNSKNLLQKNNECLLNSEGGVAHLPELSSNKTEASTGEKNPLEIESADSWNLSSDLNSEYKESPLSLEASSISLSSISNQHLVKSPSFATHKPSSASDVQGVTANVPITEKGIAISSHSPADSNVSNSEINDEDQWESPQTIFASNAKELFNIGRCSSPVVQNPSSVTEMPSVESGIKDGNGENEESNSPTVCQLYWLKQRKTKYCTLTCSRKNTREQIILSRRGIKKNCEGYCLESSSVEISYSQNNEMQKNGEGAANKASQTVDCSVNCSETNNRTLPTLSPENFIDESLEIQGKSSDLPDRIPRLSSSTYSDSSDDVSYRMQGSSENENYQFHNSTTDSSYLTEGSADSMNDRWQRSTTEDSDEEDKSDSTVRFNCDPEEGRPYSVAGKEQNVEWEVGNSDLSNASKLENGNCPGRPEDGKADSVDGKVKKMEWEYRNSQPSTSSTVQSEENCYSIPRRRRPINTNNKEKGNHPSSKKQDNFPIWNSNMEIKHPHTFSEDGDSNQMSNCSDEEGNESFYDDRKDVKPLKYNLKYENLDLSILDSSPCITIKLVCEKEVENPKLPVPQLRQMRTPDHRLSSNYEIVLTPEASSSVSFSDVPYAEISKLNLTVTSGQEDGHEIMNSPVPILEEITIPEKKSEDHTENASGISESELKDDLNSSETEKEKLRHTEKTSGISESELKDDLNSSETEKEKLRHTEKANGISESELKDDLNSSETEKEKLSDNSTNENVIDNKESAERKQLDAHSTEKNLCDLNSNNNEPYVENEIVNTSDALSELIKNDFNFETENLKLNYKPTPQSGTIDVSFRQSKNCKKLVFKSEEKKLYVKMTPPH